ncbi:PD-(D/E)XK nuclease family protein [Lapidilactobacillus salsurivasis]
MSLRVIYGLQQDDVTGEMYQQIGQAYQRSPEKQFICLVPNHIKFSSEVRILQAIGASDPRLSSNGLIASSRLQILSFSRLLWYFLRDDPYYQQPQLTAASQAMLLSELLNREREQFPIFYGERRRMGFLEQLGAQLTELTQGEFSPTDLHQAATQLATQGVPRSTTAKLQELSRILQLYQAEIASHFVTNEQLMTYLIAQVAQRDFSQFEIFIDGFSEFNQQQLSLIRGFLRQGATVYLTLYLPAATSQIPYYFDSSWRILKQLGYDSLADLGTAALFPARQKRLSSELQQVEDFWIASNAGLPVAAPTTLARQNLQVWQADSLTSEVRGVANYIRQLVALQGYRYRDFLVLAEDLNVYSATIEALFRQNELPFFSDQQTPMANHPFVVFVRSLLALSRGNFQLNDLLVLLRTELWRPAAQSLAEFRQQLDWLENYALEFGLRSYHWLKATPWPMVGPYVKQPVDPAPHSSPEQVAQQAAIENLHQFYGQALKQWQQTVKRVTNGAEFAQALFEFLQQNGVITRLREWAQADVTANDLVLAQRPQQTYQAFIGLLDDYVQVWGAQSFDLALFTDLLNAGFSNTEFAQIPATLDAVLVSKIGMVQTQTQRITIILGATRQNLPSLTQGQQLIDDQERQLLNQLHQEPGEPQLRQASVESSADLPLRYANIFFSSNERLIFTYPSHNDQQGAQEVSPYVLRLQKQFKLGAPAYLADHPQLEPTRQQQPALGYAASRAGVAEPLLLLAREAQTKRTDLPADWQRVAAVLLAGPAGAFYRRQWQSLSYRNQAVDLNPKNVARLYGDHLFSSVSQLESFYMNPYEFFLQYGLRLRPRQRFAVDSADTGTYFHDYLDRFLKAVVATNKPLSELTANELTQITTSLQEALADDPRYQLLNGPGQMRYFARRLATTSAFMANVLQQQASHSFLQPAKTEIQFGQISAPGQLPALDFKLPGQRELSVRGKIDRLDVGQWGPDWYYQIIDYKSGQKKFDYTRVFYGLSLQLLTYLQSVQDNRQRLSLPEATSIGAFYLHLSDQKMTYQTGLDDAKTLLAQILDDHRYNGILLENTTTPDATTAESLQANQDYLAALDPANQASKSSLYPRGFTKKNGYAVTSDNGFPRPQLPELLAFNRHLLTQAAIEIFSGKLRIAPYRIGADETGLRYSDFTSIMMFDAMLPENQYRQLITLDKTDFLAELMKFTAAQAAKEGQPHA